MSFAPNKRLNIEVAEEEEGYPPHRQREGVWPSGGWSEAHPRCSPEEEDHWEMGEPEVIAEPIQKVNLNTCHPTTHSSTTSERRLSDASVM